MNLDIISKLEKILNESNEQWESAKDKANSFIADARSRGAHHEDTIKGKVKEDSDESITKKATEDIDDNDDDKETNNEKVSTPDESPSTINLSDAKEFKNLIKILNQFRASRSLSDKEVKVELEEYFNKLTDSEKKVLHVFIKGLVQVTLLDVDGKSAYSPSDLKFEIEKRGSATSEKLKSIARKQQSKEDAKKLSNAPITIGPESQVKTEVYEVFRRNND